MKTTTNTTTPTTKEAKVTMSVFPTTAQKQFTMDWDLILKGAFCADQMELRYTA